MNGVEINLAQKEFDLLLYLAENPNRVFSKDELFEKIWGFDAIIRYCNCYSTYWKS